ncbi:MAG: orotate phosphoribosyltransferase [Prevotella sp.]|jgi:orotate phosphoribosyltransferase|nr:orotate phosphoribosyltransferase [Prevotella sp.]
MDAKELLAEQLLKIKAIKLQPNDPFTWASGWKSPFYCDNRKTLSYPFIRTLVKNAMVSDILNNFTEAEAIVGVATGGVPQGALVADELNLPFGYVRSKPKDHGMGNMIEGDVKKGAKVVVCEDLVSTGGSSLKAVEALREAGYDVIGMVASYTYQFDVAKEAFNNANVKLVTVTDYEHVVKQALASGYIKESDVETLHAWRSNPSQWGK